MFDTIYDISLLLVILYIAMSLYNVCIFISLLYDFVLIAKGGIIIVTVQTLYRRAHNNVSILHDIEYCDY